MTDKLSEVMTFPMCCIHCGTLFDILRILDGV